MLENWCYESDPLLLMSGHVDDHSQKMPADLLQSIIDSKKANAGVFNKRQCILGLFDQVRGGAGGRSGDGRSAGGPGWGTRDHDPTRMYRAVQSDVSAVHARGSGSSGDEWPSII
jgi:hypothetical protein